MRRIGLVAALSILVVVICVLLARRFLVSRLSVPAPIQAPVSAEEMHRTWIESVSSTLAAFDQHQDARAARDALVKLMVTKDDKEIHLNLVLAFQAFLDGNKNAAVLLRRARQLFSSRK
ncbi:MAG TPA: hypothetical protein VFQ60_03115 [Patescibacteria group bacterium]|nr:hypothetical protein [Patescibacteria group bacterium]